VSLTIRYPKQGFKQTFSLIIVITDMFAQKCLQHMAIRLHTDLSAFAVALPVIIIASLIRKVPRGALHEFRVTRYRLPQHR